LQSFRGRALEGWHSVDANGRGPSVGLEEEDDEEEEEDAADLAFFFLGTSSSLSDIIFVADKCW